MAEFCSDVDCELVLVDGVLLETCKSSVISRSISNAPEWTELTFAIGVSLAPQCGTSLLVLARMSLRLRALAGL